MKTIEKKGFYPYGCKFLIETYRNHFEAWKFAFDCNWRSNRSGFVHEWELTFWENFYPSCSSKIQYYNRTRERFWFESLIKNLFVDFLYSKDWRFREENKDDIMKLSNDLNMNIWKVFKFMKAKKDLIKELN